jgi:hypothetical protein
MTLDYGLWKKTKKIIKLLEQIKLLIMIFQNYTILQYMNLDENFNFIKRYDSKLIFINKKNGY